MKKISLIMILTILCFTFSTVAFAHPGNTDSNGGHYGPDGYHYHHGYPTHQHENGECPYDFDDKTGWNSGSSSSGSSHTSKTTSSNSVNTNTEAKNQSQFDFILEIVLAFIFVAYPISLGCSFLLFGWIATMLLKISLPGYAFELWIAVSVPIALISEYCAFDDGSTIILPVLIFISIVFFFCYWYKLHMDNIAAQERMLQEEKRKEQEKQEKLRQEQEKLRQEQEKFEQEKQYYTNKYGGKPAEQFVSIPPNIIIGDDNLPCEKDAKEYWGENLTIFITKNGNKYHRSTCRYGEYPYNIYRLSSYYSPCAKCKPANIPDKTWYKEYLRIQQIKEHYGIK